jgi:hypothetical protein
MLGAVRQPIKACKDSREIRPGANPRIFWCLWGSYGESFHPRPAKRASRDFMRLPYVAKRGA